MHRRHELLGVLAACLSSVLGGASVVATRYVIAATDPVTLTVLRFGVGTLCMLPLVLMLRRPLPARADLMPALALGVLFFAVFPWLFNASLSSTTAARGSLALSTLPFLTLFAAALLGVERLTILKAAGVAVAIGGVALALGDRLTAVPDGPFRGDLLMIAAAACGAVYNVLSRRYIAQSSALSYTAIGMLAGAATSAVIAAAVGEPSLVRRFDLEAWAAVAFLGVVGAGLTFFLWSYGLEHTTPTQVAVTVTLNPVASMLLGALVLGEAPHLPWFVGLVAVAAGVVLVNARATPADSGFPLGPPSWRSKLQEWRTHRRRRQDLMDLDDRALEDIGMLHLVGGHRRRWRAYWWLSFYR